MFKKIALALAMLAFPAFAMAACNPFVPNTVLTASALNNAIASPCITSGTISGAIISGSSINGSAIGTTAPGSGIFTTISGSSLSIGGTNLAGANGASIVGYNQGGTGAVTITQQAKNQQFPAPKDFGAAGDGSTDDSTAIQNALNTGDIIFDRSTYKTNTAPTGSYSLISIGGAFNGTNPIDGAYPAFGPGAFRAISVGGLTNSIIGIVRNTQTANTNAFPTAITAYARNDNGGNTAFGIYAPAYQYATTGVVTNEIDSFNMTAAPSATLPPNRAIGTTQNVPVAATVAAGGNFASAIGIHITQEGSSPQSFLTGIYMSATCCTNYGLYSDATVPNYLAGTLGIAVLPDSNSKLKVSSGGATAAASFITSGSTGTIAITDSGGNGANLNFAGNGATTPNKTIRVQGGKLQVVNSGYSGVVFGLDDSGGIYPASGNILISSTAPAISSGFGGTPSIPNNNGTAAFEVNVGTGGTASSGVVGLPTAAHGWTCAANDETTTSATVFMTKQTASTTASVTFTNYNTSGATAAWAANDILHVSCMAY
jgi:hypothetical protein